MARTKHHIGRYRVIAPIGAGGFSTVYRALDEASGEEVAIKVLAENHSLVRETRRRFVDEFKLMATVHSPAIARIYEVGETETGQPFMVLELANRGDLRRRVEEIRRSYRVLNRADLMMLANHLAEALGTLHDADIVHRDVSPGNILIRSRLSAVTRRGALDRGDITLLEPGERFLLADLGHAKDLVLASGFTAGGGTRGFASPEQRDDVTVVDRRADIFSATAIIEWAAHDGRFADALEPFFDVGLASEPDERFDSMAQWHTGLSAALGTAQRTTPRSRFGRRGQFSPADPISDIRAESRISPAVEAAMEVTDEAATGPGRRRLGRILAGAAALAVVAALGAGALYTLEIGPFAVADSAVETAGDGDTTDTSTTATVASGETASPTTGTGPDGGTLVVPEADPEPGSLPWVAIDAPMDGETIEGDLLLAGTAEFDLGIDHVEFTLERLTDNLWWDDRSGEFEAESTRIDVGLSEVESIDGTPARGRFVVVVPGEVLESGSYRLQVWARGLDDESPAEPAVRLVEVP